MFYGTVINNFFSKAGHVCSLTKHRTAILLTLSQKSLQIANTFYFLGITQFQNKIKSVPKFTPKTSRDTLKAIMAGP